MLVGEIVKFIGRVWGERERAAGGSGGQWFVWVFVILCEFLRMKCGLVEGISEGGVNRNV